MAIREIPLRQFFNTYQQWYAPLDMLYAQGYDYVNSKTGEKAIVPVPVDLRDWRQAMRNIVKWPRYRREIYFALSMWVFLENRPPPPAILRTPIDELAAEMFCAYKDTRRYRAELGKVLLAKKSGLGKFKEIIEKVMRSRDVTKSEETFFEEIAKEVFREISESGGTLPVTPIAVTVPPQECNYDFHNLFNFIDQGIIQELCVEDPGIPPSSTLPNGHLTSNRAANLLVEVATPYFKMFDEAVVFLKHLTIVEREDKITEIKKEVVPMLKTLYNVAKATIFFYEDQHTVPLCISWPNLEAQRVPRANYNVDELSAHGSEEQPLIAQPFNLPLCLTAAEAGGGAAKGRTAPEAGGGAAPAAAEQLTVRIGDFVPLEKMPVAVYIPLDLDHIEEWKTYFNVVKKLIKYFNAEFFQKSIGDLFASEGNGKPDDFAPTEKLMAKSESYSQKLNAILQAETPSTILSELSVMAEFLMGSSGFSEGSSLGLAEDSDTNFGKCIEKMSDFVDAFRVFYPPLLKREFQQAFGVSPETLEKEGRVFKFSIMAKVENIQMCIDVIDQRQSLIRGQFEHYNGLEEDGDFKKLVQFKGGEKIYSHKSTRVPADYVFYVHETVVTSTRPRPGKDTFEVVLEDPIPSVFSHSILAGMRIVVDRYEVEEFLRSIKSLFGSSQAEKERIGQLLDRPGTYSQVRDEKIISRGLLDFWTTHSEFVAERVSVEIYTDEEIKTIPLTVDIFKANTDYLHRTDPIIDPLWPRVRDARALNEMIIRYKFFNEDDDDEFMPRSTRDQKMDALEQAALEYLAPFIRRLGLKENDKHVFEILKAWFESVETSRKNLKITQERDVRVGKEVAYGGERAVIIDVVNGEEVTLRRVSDDEIIEPNALIVDLQKLETITNPTVDEREEAIPEKEPAKVDLLFQKDDVIVYDEEMTLEAFEKLLERTPFEDLSGSQFKKFRVLRDVHKGKKTVDLENVQTKEKITANVEQVAPFTILHYQKLLINDEDVALNEDEQKTLDKIRAIDRYESDRAEDEERRVPEQMILLRDLKLMRSFRTELPTAEKSFFLSALWANYKTLFDGEGAGFDVEDITKVDALGKPAAFPTHAELLYVWMNNEEMYNTKVEEMFAVLQRVTNKYRARRGEPGADYYDDTLSYQSKIQALAREMYPNDDTEEVIANFTRVVSEQILPRMVPKRRADDTTFMLQFEEPLHYTLAQCAERKIRNMQETKDSIDFQNVALVRECNGGFPDAEVLMRKLPAGYESNWNVSEIVKTPMPKSFEELAIKFDNTREETFRFNFQLLENTSFLKMMKDLGIKNPFKAEFWAVWRRLCVFPHLEVDPRHENMAIQFVSDVIGVFQLVPEKGLTKITYTIEGFKEKARDLVGMWDGIFDHDTIFRCAVHIVKSYLEKMSGETRSVGVDGGSPKAGGGPRPARRDRAEEGDPPEQQTKRLASENASENKRTRSPEKVAGGGAAPPTKRKPKKEAGGEYIHNRSLAVV